MYLTETEINKIAHEYATLNLERHYASSSEREGYTNRINQILKTLASVSPEAATEVLNRTREITRRIFH